MAKGRIEFPPTPTISAATQLDPRFAGRVPGGARSGLAVVNFHAISLSTWSNPVVRLYSACDLELDPNMGTTGSNWFNLGATAVIGSGDKSLTITLGAMSEWIRWAFEIGGGSGGSIRFSVVVHPFDA